MPKIVIKEKDMTSAGTPGSYGNHSVLITGYAQRPAVLAKDVTYNKTDKKWYKKGSTTEESVAPDAIQPDENGVYEFSSKQAFLDTIGDFKDAEAEICKKDGDTIKEYHYGYRMARELLDMGYDIIYKVINSVTEMDDAKFWEIFKDKASYDFRFVSHGMLETCYDQEKHTKYYTRLEYIEDALKKLEALEISVGGKAITYTEYEALDNTEKEKYQAAYVAAKYAFTDNAAIGNATNDTGMTYTDYAGAKVGLDGDRTEVKNLIEAHNKQEFTRTTFNNINGHIAALAAYKEMDDGTPIAEGRGDCVALIELDEDIYCEADPTKRPEILIAEGISSLSGVGVIGTAGEYCALTVPSVYYVTSDEPMKMPGAFHYLACYMGSLSAGFAEWYAAAGYTRGVSAKVIDHTSVKLGEIAIGVLEPRNHDDKPQTTQAKFACNVIANFRGSYYLWGNRTAATIGEEAAGDDLTAENFLNIRQLCSTLKKQLYVSCRRFTFDPNSDTLWINFVNSITPTLDRMKADQGIRDYKIVKIYTDKKATLKARIRIIPIEAVEDFDITVTLEDSFGETSVTAV